MDKQEPVAWMWEVNSGAGYTSRGIDFYPTNIPFAKQTALYPAPSPQLKEEPEPVIFKIFKPTPPRGAELLHGIHKDKLPWVYDQDPASGNVASMWVTPVYTVPPQRERIVFPMMLRKMWSGDEVQAWLDENVNKEKNT